MSVTFEWTCKSSLCKLREFTLHTMEKMNRRLHLSHIITPASWRLLSGTCLGLLVGTGQWRHKRHEGTIFSMCARFCSKKFSIIWSCLYLMSRYLRRYSCVTALAFGTLYIHVFGNERRRFYVESGDAIQDVKIAERLCESGDVLLSPFLWNFCKPSRYSYEYHKDKMHVKVRLQKGSCWFALMRRCKKVTRTLASTQTMSRWYICLSDNLKMHWNCNEIFKTEIRMNVLLDNSLAARQRLAPNYRP